MTTEHIPPNGPGQFAAWKRDIERRLENIERSRRLDNASFTGRMRGTDDAGLDRIYLGDLGNGSFGIEVRDDSGVTVFRADEGGMQRPSLNMPYRRVEDPISVTSSSFVGTWETGIGSITHRAIRWVAVILVDAGTSGEVRLHEAGGPSTTSVIPVSAGATVEDTTAVFSWAVAGWTPGPIDPYVLMQMQARRTGGSGVIRVYPPDTLRMGTISELGATASGL